MAYEHSEGWGAASTKIVISGGFGAGQTTFVGAVAESCRCAPRRWSPTRLRGWTASNESPCQLHVYGGASDRLAHNPEGAGSNPVPATIVMSRGIVDRCPETWFTPIACFRVSFRI